MAGRLTLGIAAALCVLTAVVCRLGLRPGVPAEREERRPLAALMREGLAAARLNPRIWFAFMLQFVSFADRIVIGTFFTLRLQQSAIERGLSVTEAASAARIPYVTAQAAALLVAVFFGLMLDRVDRIKVGVIAMAVAGLGYFAGGFVGDPLGDWILPVAVLLGAGQVCAILASQTVLGQEAPPAVRGAVFGLAGICASAGILFTNIFGGTLFDLVGKGAPFFLIAAVNAGIMLFGLSLLRRAPAA